MVPAPPAWGPSRIVPATAPFSRPEAGARRKPEPASPWVDPCFRIPREGKSGRPRAALPRRAFDVKRPRNRCKHGYLSPRRLRTRGSYRSGRSPDPLTGGRRPAPAPQLPHRDRPGQRGEFPLAHPGPAVAAPRPLDQVVFAAEPSPPAEVAGPPAVLAHDHVDAHRPQRRDIRVRAGIAVRQEDVARLQPSAVPAGGERAGRQPRAARHSLRRATSPWQEWSSLWTWARKAARVTAG